MSNTLSRGLAVLILFVVPLALTGCAGSGRMDANPSQAKAKSDTPKADEKKNDDKAEKLAKELESMQQTLERMERELAIKELSLQKTEHSRKLSLTQSEQTIKRAERELAMAQRKMEKFLNEDVPQRIQRAELGLKYTQDRFQEAQEELNQLELLYNEEEFAEKTKEIVLERGRRRLARSEENLQLSQRDVRILKEITIPVERDEWKHRVHDKELELQKKRRDLEINRIAQEIAILNAQNALQKQHEDIENQQDKITEKREALEELE